MSDCYLQPAPGLIQDKSFTCTLFAPTTEFETLSNKDQVLSWFGIHFPDILELIGTEGLLNSFQQNPRNPLISIKVWQFSFLLTPLANMFFFSLSADKAIPLQGSCDHLGGRGTFYGSLLRSRPELRS
jgi:hypothetical protein